MYPFQEVKMTKLKQEYQAKGAVQYWKDIDYDPPINKTNNEAIRYYHTQLQMGEDFRDKDWKTKHELIRNR